MSQAIVGELHHERRERQRLEREVEVLAAQRSALKVERDRLRAQVGDAGAAAAEALAERDRQRLERIATLETALAELLKVAERDRAGYPVDGERWYTTRDAARAALKAGGA